jgi:acetaldehyde dehydrogenase/alcohol dehydrogenase
VIDQLRAAQRVSAGYGQDRVDQIFLAAARAAAKQRIPLARMAVAETGMGVVEDKVIKNLYASEYIYNTYKHTKTCGVIEEDRTYGWKKIARPIGLVAAVIPVTSPASSTIFKSLMALKTRNGIILSPHPQAKNCAVAAAKIVLDAAMEAGAPEGIIGWIDEPCLELVIAAMKEADIILATGGPDMVRAAYSSGKPVIGGSSGNVPAIIDDSADIPLAVNSIIHSKTFDNGMICASEQSVIALSAVYGTVKSEFLRRGCYFLNPAEKEKLRKTIIVNGTLNSNIRGQKAHTIAALAGLVVPESTKILIGEIESVERSEEFSHEKLSPVLGIYRAGDFNKALDKAEALIQDGGYGHTASLYVDTVGGEEKIARFGERMKTCRLIVNTPLSQGGIGDPYNFKIAPSELLHLLSVLR